MPLVRYLWLLLLFLPALACADTSPSTKQIPASWRSCEHRLRDADAKIARRLPTWIAFRHHRTFMQDGALVLEEDSTDPIFGVDIAPMVGTGDTGWVPADRSASRQYRGWMAVVSLGLRRVDEKTLAVIYTTFEQALDRCLEELAL